MRSSRSLTIVIGLLLAAQTTVPAAPRSGSETGPAVGAAIGRVSHVVIAAPAPLGPHRVTGVAGLGTQLADAVAVFDAAGLALPALVIHIHADRSGCQGHDGLFDADRSGRRIDLCSDGVVLHELAHAWLRHALSDATRQRFIDRVEAEVWNHAETPWHRRGVELAANTIAWGLAATPLAPTEAYEFAELLERFELLAGRPSPRLPEVTV